MVKTESQYKQNDFQLKTSLGGGADRFGEQPINQAGGGFDNFTERVIK